MSVNLAQLDVVANYLPQGEQEMVATAYRLVSGTQLGANYRHSLDDAFVALEILADWNMPGPSLLAVLLRRVLEQRLISEKELLQTFNTEAVELTKQLVKLDQDPVTDVHESDAMRKMHRALKLRQLFITTYRNPELPLLCIAEHWAKLSQTESLSETEKYLIAEDTEAIFLPLLEMLGMWRWRRKLGDISLRVLHPKDYERIQELLEVSKHNNVQSYTKIKETLEREFDANSIAGEIHLHDSAPSTIYQRALRGETLEEVAKRLRIDVLVSSYLDCYQVLGLIHRHWKSWGTRFVDLIATPKFNGYRALHVSLPYEPTDRKGPKALDFYIRTPDMQQINDEGIVVAKICSESIPRVVKNAWWEDSDERTMVCQQEPGSTTPKIYVFSPVGQIFWLPEDSTPIDYAYQVHTDLGPHCTRIWVNGCLATYDQRLRSGDLVQIQFDRSHTGPNPQWLDAVQTATARSKIKRALREREQTAHKGRQIIDKVLKDILRTYEMKIPPGEVEQFLSKTARRLKYPDLEALYLDVARGKQSPSRIIGRLISSQFAKSIVDEKGERLPVIEDRIHVAQCRDERCKVRPGLEIVGHIRQPGSPHAQLTVHGRSCPNALKIEDPILLSWGGSDIQQEAAEITMLAWDRAQLLGDLLQQIYALNNKGLYLDRVHADVNPDQSAHIDVTVHAPTQELISSVVQGLEAFKAKGDIKDIRVWQLSPAEKRLLTGRAGIKGHNPYTLQEVRTRAMFFGRDEEIGRIKNCIGTDQNLVVLRGEKRVGKTSLLIQLRDYHLSEMRELPVLVDMQRITNFNITEVVLEMGTAIREGVLNKTAAGIPRLKRKQISDNPVWHLGKFINDIKSKLPGYRFFIMIDEFSKIEQAWREGKLSADFFDQMRWLISGQRDVDFLLCIQEASFRITQSTRSGSWHLLQKGDHIRLKELEKEATVNLIRQPVRELTYYEPVINRIVDLTACNPYFVQIICHEIVARIADRETHLVTMEDLNAVLTGILDNGDHYFAHFLDEATEFELYVLAAIAHSEKSSDGWVKTASARVLLQDQGFSTKHEEFINAVKVLHSRGVINNKKWGNAWICRIPVGLFELWLKDNIPLTAAS